MAKSVFNLKATIKVTRDNTRELLESISMLARNEVLVGVPAETAGRENENGEPINNASLAYLHNYGSPTQNIPARPFLDPGIAQAREPIVAQLRSAGDAALAGNPQGVLKGLHAAGIVAVSAVKNKINTGPFAPLKPATLAARRRHGRTGTKPLIDTARMLGAMSYIVRERK